MSKKLLLIASICTSVAYAFAAHAAPLTHSSIIAAPSAHSSAHLVNELQIEGAQSFISNLADRGVGFLGNAALSQEDKSTEFAKLLNQSFDLETIGKFALGRYWKTASSEQQKEYQKLFKVMVVKVYSQRFKDYNGQDLVVKGAQPQGSSDILVKSMITGKGQEIPLDWRVRYKNGQYQVIDVLVAGVSMALTQRADFASVIQRGGGNIDVLIDHLKKN